MFKNLTDEFKSLVKALLIAVAFISVGFGEYRLFNDVKALQSEVAKKPIVIIKEVAPSITPTASVSATPVKVKVIVPSISK